jgi:hypothetical protein
MTKELMKRKFQQSMIKHDLDKYFSLDIVGTLTEDEKDLLAYVYVESSDTQLAAKVLGAYRDCDDKFIRR